MAASLINLEEILRRVAGPVILLILRFHGKHVFTGGEIPLI